MMDTKWVRVGAAAGILFVLLLVAAQVIAPTPGPKAATGTIVTYYLHNRTAALWSGYVGGLSVAMQLIFVVALFSVLRHGEERAGPPLLLMLGAGVALLPVVLVSSAFSVAAAWDGGQPGGAAVTRALFDLSNATLIFSDLVIGIFLVAAALATLERRVLPRWLGWLGLLAAALLIAGTVSLFNPGGSFGGAPGLLLYLIWVILTSVVMVRRARVHGVESVEARQPGPALG